MRKGSFTVSNRNILLESYCENGACQVRYFHFYIKPYDRQETVRAKELYCPLCGKQTSHWVHPSVYDWPLPRETFDARELVSLPKFLSQEVALVGEWERDGHGRKVRRAHRDRTGGAP